MNASFTPRGNSSPPCASRPRGATRLFTILDQIVKLEGGTPLDPGAVIRVGGRLLLWESTGMVSDLGPA